MVEVEIIYRKEMEHLKLEIPLNLREFRNEQERFMRVVEELARMQKKVVDSAAISKGVNSLQEQHAKEVATIQ